MCPFKIQQLIKYKIDKILSIKLKTTLNVLTFNNAWLAVFFEANGSAQISIVNDKIYIIGKSVRLHINLNQKDLFLLYLIANFFVFNEKRSAKVKFRLLLI